MTMRLVPFGTDHIKTGGRATTTFLRMLLAVFVWAVVAAVVIALLFGLVDLLWGAEFADIYRQLLGL